MRVFLYGLNKVKWIVFINKSKRKWIFTPLNWRKGFSLFEMICYLVNKVLPHISSDAFDPLKYLSILSYSWWMLTKFQLKFYSNLAQILLTSCSNPAEILVKFWILIPVEFWYIMFNIVCKSSPLNCVFYYAVLWLFDQRVSLFRPSMRQRRD